MVDLVLAGLVLVIVGFGALVVSTLQGARRRNAEVRGGGVVMIGPIPVIFGSDSKWASVAILLAIVLILVYFLGVP